MPPTPTVTPNGPRIRELRESSRRSRRDLADEIGCHESTIGTIERNRKVSLILLGQVADELGVALNTITLSDEPAECQA